jgi:hypothetical protein
MKPFDRRRAPRKDDLMPKSRPRTLAMVLILTLSVAALAPAVYATPPSSEASVPTLWAIILDSIRSLHTFQVGQPERNAGPSETTPSGKLEAVTANDSSHPEWDPSGSAVGTDPYASQTTACAGECHPEWDPDG